MGTRGRTLPLGEPGKAALMMEAGEPTASEVAMSVLVQPRSARSGSGKALMRYMTALCKRRLPGVTDFPAVEHDAVLDAEPEGAPEMTGKAGHPAVTGLVCSRCVVRVQRAGGQKSRELAGAKPWEKASSRVPK